MQRIRNTLGMALLAVAFSLASGSFVALSAQQTDPPGVDVGPDVQHEFVGEEIDHADSAQFTAARPGLQAVNMTDRVQNHLKPSSKLSADLRKRGGNNLKTSSMPPADLRKRGGNKQLDRGADQALDAQARR
jgi:hypothetical protein